MNVESLINKAFGQRNEKIDFKLMRYTLLLMASSLRILELHVQITDETDSFKIQREREIRDHFLNPERKTTRYEKQGYNKVKRDPDTPEDVHVISKKSNKLPPEIMLKKLAKDKNSAKNAKLKQTQQLKQKQQLRKRKEQDSFITDMNPYKMKTLSHHDAKDPEEPNETNNTYYKQSLQRYGKEKLEDTHTLKKNTIAEEMKIKDSEMIAYQSDETEERHKRLFEDKKHKMILDSNNSDNQLYKRQTEDDMKEYDENNEIINNIGLQKKIRIKGEVISEKDNYSEFDEKIDPKKRQLRNADVPQSMGERKIIGSGNYDQQLIKNADGRKTEAETEAYNENYEIGSNLGVQKTLRKTGQVIYGKDNTRIYKNDDLINEPKTLLSRKGDKIQIMGKQLIKNADGKQTEAETEEYNKNYAIGNNVGLQKTLRKTGELIYGKDNTRIYNNEDVINGPKTILSRMGHKIKIMDDKSASDDMNTSKSRESSINLKGSIEIVTRSQFETLKSAVEQLERNIGPISMPTVPSDEKFKDDVLNGKTKLTSTMIAIQLHSRIQAIENMSKRLKEIIKIMVKLRVLTKDVIMLIDEEPIIEVDADEILPTTKIDKSSPSKILNMSIIRDITDREMTLYLEATKNNVLEKIIKYLSETNKNSMSAGERIIHLGGRLRNVDKYANHELMLRDKIYYSDEVLNFFRKGIGPEIEECKRELNTNYEDVQKCIKDFKASLGKVADSVAVSAMKERFHAFKKKIMKYRNRHESMVERNRKLSDNIQVLLKQAFTMQSQKADIEEMNDTLNDKVDKEVVHALLVTKETYDHTTKQIKAKFLSLNDINLRHDQRWRVAYNDLSHILLTKADECNFDEWEKENMKKFEELNQKIYNISLKCALPEAAVVTVPRIKSMEHGKPRVAADKMKKDHQNIGRNCFCNETDSDDERTT